MAAPRPNILMIVTDQERAWSALPHNMELPARDRLRERSVAFTNHHVNAVACGPSRSVIYTGQHIQHTGLYDNPSDRSLGADLNPNIATLGTMLKEAGYRTAYKGKWHISVLPQPANNDHRQSLCRHGFNEYQFAADDFGHAHGGFTLDPEIAGDAAAWLHRNAGADGRPWFLAVNFINPHDIMFFDATGRQERSRLEPGQVAPMLPAPEAEPYGGEEIGALPASLTESFDGRPKAHRRFLEHNRQFYGDLPRGDLDAWRRYRRYYFDCLRDVDRAIGTVLDALDHSSQSDKTIVLFTSDHGEMAGDHGLRAKGPVIYREVVCVPLLISHPDVKAGVSTTALSSAVDIAPTLLSFAGVTTDEQGARWPGLVGYDLSACLADSACRGTRAEQAGGLLINYSAVHASNPDLNRRKVGATRKAGQVGPEAIVELDQRTFYRALFDGRYRFARYFRPDDHQAPISWEDLVGRQDLELYDTVSDPAETINLAANPTSHRGLIERLNRLLNALIAEEVGLDDGRHMPGLPEWWRC